MFERHVPARYATRPRTSCTGDDGIEQWIFQGSDRGSMGLNAVGVVAQGGVGHGPDDLRRDAAGRLRHPRAGPRHEPQRRSSRRCASRPSPGSARGIFQEAEDKDLALVMLQAYNDWHIDEWCRRVPRPVHPARHPAGVGPEALVAEVRRVAAKGCRAITMPELPHIQGLPSYHNVDYWDPFFRAVSDEDVVMCLHIGQGFAAINTPPTRRSTT